MGAAVVWCDGTEKNIQEIHREDGRETTMMPNYTPSFPLSAVPSKTSRTEKAVVGVELHRLPWCLGASEDRRLGPLIIKMSVLQALYTMIERLSTHRSKFEVRWAKVHMSSVGNGAADKVAKHFQDYQDHLQEFSYRQNTQ